MTKVTNKKRSKKVQKAIDDIASSDVVIVEKALSVLSEKKDPETISVLLQQLENQADPKIVKCFTDFISNLKDTSVLQTLLNYIASGENIAIKNQLISCLWQSAYDLSEHVPFFVKQALKGDYTTIFEVYTLIDNLDTTLDEELKQDLFYDVNEQMEEEQDEEKRNVLLLLQQLFS